MITRKELNYVNAWSSKVPFPGISYCEQTMEKLQVTIKIKEALKEPNRSENSEELETFVKGLINSGK